MRRSRREARPKSSSLPFLLWAATSVRWHRALAHRRVHAAPEQPESLILLGYWLVLGLFLAVLLFRLTPGSDVAGALTEGLFTLPPSFPRRGCPPRRTAMPICPPGFSFWSRWWARRALCGGRAQDPAGAGDDVARARRSRAPDFSQYRPAFAHGGGRNRPRHARRLDRACRSVRDPRGGDRDPGLRRPQLRGRAHGAVAAISNSGPLYDASGQDWPPFQACRSFRCSAQPSL